MAALATAGGTSVITETVFENRFTHASELARMGADIKIEGRGAVIEGVRKLTGAQVRTTDLRAGAALTIAALGSEGVSEIHDIHHIERGYKEFDKKLKGLGAKITRIEDV
jgi:UDP-N-acetylglucosamine 1-carboxyvinyltransferase